MKKRSKIKENRRRKREEKLDLIDYCGVKDPTAYEAVKNIIRKERRTMSKLYPQGAW